MFQDVSKVLFDGETVSPIENMNLIVVCNETKSKVLLFECLIRYANKILCCSIRTNQRYAIQTKIHFKAFENKEASFE